MKLTKRQKASIIASFLSLNCNRPQPSLLQDVGKELVDLKEGDLQRFKR